MRLIRSFFVTVIQTFLLSLTNSKIQIAAAQTTRQQQSQRLHVSNHNSNYAIILQSSVFFHNYRHTSNALAIYQSLKQHGGFTDDHILLFLGDEVACNERNPIKDTILPYRTNPHTQNIDLTHVGSSGEEVEVDYGGEDVTVDNFLRVLQGRHHPFTPASQRLPLTMNSDSNLFIYITGHGGDEFFKFRDKEELTMTALRLALDEMQFRGRFGKILFITDTCQAFTLAPNTIENDRVADGALPAWVPVVDGLLPSWLPFGSSGSREKKKGPGPLRNVYTIGSSTKDHNSYSHHSDSIIGHSVMDRYVHGFMKYMGWTYTTPPLTNSQSSGGYKWDKMDQMSVKEALVDSTYDRNGDSIMGTEIGWTDHGCDVKMEDVRLSDFMVMRRRGSVGGGGSTNAQGGTQVDALADGVDFTKQATTMTPSPPPPLTDARDTNLKRNTVEINGSTTKEDEKYSSHLGYEQMGEGTNPKDPMFVVSVFVSLLGIWYSSPYLW